MGLSLYFVYHVCILCIVFVFCVLSLYLVYNKLGGDVELLPTNNLLRLCTGMFMKVFYIIIVM